MAMTSAAVAMDQTEPAARQASGALPRALRETELARKRPSRPEGYPEDLYWLVEDAVRRINAIAGEQIIKSYEIGWYVWEELLQEGRAEYGARVVEQIADHPTLHVSRSTLFNCISLARAYPELKSGQVPIRLTGMSLSHLYILSRIEDPEDRAWFERKAVKKNMSVRRLELYCQLRDYKRPQPQEEPVLDTAGDEVECDHPPRLTEGEFSPSELRRILIAIPGLPWRALLCGNLGKRKASPNSDDVFTDRGIAHLRREDLCLMRAFVEIAAAKGCDRIDVRREENGVLLTAGGATLTVECR